MLKNKQIAVNSDILYKISLNLLNHYYIEPNLYYLLLLSYLTVKEFSRNHEQLDKNAKMDLCIQYTPDLIIGLGQSKIIENNLALDLKNQLATIDAKSIFEVYHYIFSTIKNDKVKIGGIFSCLK
jgi:CRISPR/Cas system CMR subunit Cmr6 (Cas7 group RAMP superfamily)